MSHETAHETGPAAESQKQIDHPLVPAGPAKLLKTQNELQELVEQLRQAGRFAYDSEFIGELTYVPKLCLVQVASADQIALIDPLAELDLHPFWELIADPSVEKIVHAGAQDLEPVVRHLGRAPANVFDTQIAGGFVALPYPLSLSKLVHETTGVKLGKGLTFTHWDQRPLSAMQLRYAADDVRYLLLARQELARRLDALGHARWAAEECANQCDPEQFKFDPQQQYLRVRGAGGLAPKNLAILRELTIWRDACAREADVPARAFVRDEVLIDLSRNPVKSVEKLDRVRGLPRPVEAEYGPQIVEITAQAMALPESRLPAVREAEPSPSDKFRIDSLWAAAQCLCAGRGLDPAVVTNRGEVSDFYNYLTARQSSPSASHRLLTGWRGEALGNPLKELVGNQLRIQLAWPNGLLESVPRRP